MEDDLSFNVGSDMMGQHMAAASHRQLSEVAAGTSGAEVAEVAEVTMVDAFEGSAGASWLPQSSGECQYICRQLSSIMVWMEQT